MTLRSCRVLCLAAWALASLQAQSTPESPTIRALAQSVQDGNATAEAAFWRQMVERGTPLVERTDEDADYALVTFVWKGSSQRPPTSQPDFVADPLNPNKVPGFPFSILELSGAPPENKPDGYTTVALYLIVDGASRTIDFLKNVFGAVELRRFPDPAGNVMHADADGTTWWIATKVD